MWPPKKPKKAKAAAATDLEGKARELAELQGVLKVRDAKLAEAQKAQVELIKKQRELDDAKRELELTVEKRVQDGLSEVRSQAKREAEDGMKFGNEVVMSMHCQNNMQCVANPR